MSNAAAAVDNEFDDVVQVAASSGACRALGPVVSRYLNGGASRRGHRRLDRLPRPGWVGYLARRTGAMSLWKSSSDSRCCFG